MTTTTTKAVKKKTKKAYNAELNAIKDKHVELKGDWQTTVYYDAQGREVKPGDYIVFSYSTSSGLRFGKVLECTQAKMTRSLHGSPNLKLKLITGGVGYHYGARGQNNAFLNGVYSCDYFHNCTIVTRETFRPELADLLDEYYSKYMEGIEEEE